MCSHIVSREKKSKSDLIAQTYTVVYSEMNVVKFSMISIKFDAYEVDK